MLKWNNVFFEENLIFMNPSLWSIYLYSRTKKEDMRNYMGISNDDGSLKLTFGKIPTEMNIYSNTYIYIEGGIFHIIAS